MDTKRRSFVFLAAVCSIAFAGDSPEVRFSGGDGSSTDTAVVIVGARSEAIGAKAEYSYIAARFPGSKVTRQTLLCQKGKSYDRLDFATADNLEKTIFFDISDFFGKF